MTATNPSPQAPPPSILRIFISHCVDDKKFVFEVCDLLAPFLGRETMYLFEKRPSLSGPFLAEIDKELQRANLILIFVGKRFDRYMDYEAMRAAILKNKLVCVIDIGAYRDVKNMPETIRTHLAGRHILFDKYTERVPQDAVGCAREILGTLEEENNRAQFPFFTGISLLWNENHVRWGLPASPNIFDYEKEMIRFYLANRCYELINQGMDDKEEAQLRARYEAALEAWSPEEIGKMLKKGIAAGWPSVWRYMPNHDNPLHKDKFRGKGGESFLRVNALLGLDVPGKPLVFLEAGPRPKLALPKVKQLKVAIVVAGGIAPGINAVIDAIVQRHDAYHKASAERDQGYNLEVIGIKNGLLAIEDTGHESHTRKLGPNDTVEYATRGGSRLGTSRDEDLLSPDPNKRSARIEVIAKELKRQKIDVLYIIGGDGSMKAAHALWHKINSSPKDSSESSRMSVVAIPKTMDNDILWVWQSFGFLSAVQEAREIIERLHTEVRSNPRLGIVQFFGSGSGFVVSHAVLAAATGHTTLALIPELDFSVIGVARYIKQRLWKAACPYGVDSGDPAAPIDPSIPHGLIVMAETAIPLDALQCLGLAEPPPNLKEFYKVIANKIHPSEDERKAIERFFDDGRRVQGQTDDYLRSLGIRILHELLPMLIKEAPLNTIIDKLPGWDEPNCKKRNQ